MDIVIEEFEVNDLIPRSISFIIGNPKSGKSTLIKDIIASIHTKYSYGVVCTDKVHKENYYSKFINERRLYNRYSSIITNRCFFSKMFLILDNCSIHQKYIEEIYDNYQGKDMLILMASLKFCNLINYDYIFISEFSNLTELYKIYTSYVENFEISAEQFIELVNQCATDKEFLVVCCKALSIDELFMTYIPETHPDLILIDE